MSENCGWELLQWQRNTRLGHGFDCQLLWSLSGVLLKTNLAKQTPHGGKRRCSLCGICFQKWKKTHLQVIISVFAESSLPPFTKARGASDVAKNGVSFVSSTSLLLTFFGAGKWTVSPSKAWRRSAHAIILGSQRKSFRNIISACSAPIHAKEPVAGFENVS